jgi:hypothetical protein
MRHGPECDKLCLELQVACRLGCWRVDGNLEASTVMRQDVIVPDSVVRPNIVLLHTWSMPAEHCSRVMRVERIRLQEMIDTGMHLVQ